MDYIFYKIYSFYKRKRYIPITMGIGFLFVLEVCVFFFLVMVLNFSTNQLFSTKYINGIGIKIVCYSLYVISTILLVIRYGAKERREQIIEKCKNGKDRFRTWHIALLPVLFIALSVLVIAIGKK